MTMNNDITEAAAPFSERQPFRVKMWILSEGGRLPEWGHYYKMAKKITEEESEMLYYRRVLLDDKLRKLTGMIDGRGSSFYPFITDSEGRVSNERTDNLISCLMESLDRHLKLTGRPSPDKDREEMYRTFLYCAMFGLKCFANPERPSVSTTAVSKTFADIVEFAEFLEPCGAETSYFFDCISESLRLLGYVVGGPDYEDEDTEGWQNEQSDSLTDEELASLEEQERISAEAFFEEEERLEVIFEALDSLGEDQLYTDNEVLREYSMEEIMDFERRKAEKELLDSAEDWRENIADHHRFFDSCDRFTKLYFSTDHTDMKKDIENMIDTFLYENGISAFSFGEDYGLITYHIEKIQSRIEAEIERAKERKKADTGRGRSNDLF